MTDDQFQRLQRGDLIRHKGGGLSLVVDAHYGDMIIAVRTHHVTSPVEWDVVDADGEVAAAMDKAADDLEAVIAKMRREP